MVFNENNRRKQQVGKVSRWCPCCKDVEVFHVYPTVGAICTNCYIPESLQDVLSLEENVIGESLRPSGKSGGPISIFY